MSPYYAFSVISRNKKNLLKFRKWLISQERFMKENAWISPVENASELLEEEKGFPSQEKSSQVNPQK